ncbi:glycoside hydrolase family 38 [Pseudoduganella aquatica]|uniref:Glycoside hydrolase family 38 n=1 Tax=Pseudoduganella aquatica TaxID=2660641 RepID=A0A7X4KK39_9BURK|nr:glycoside hydrolase family 38 [Pseudoduganella aquatica]MYN06744.1 glycoside hydrolase family 38 [Pseudoduganella aquatica]
MDTSTSSRTGVSVVVQTHWDREWYLPHQTFIARLIHVMDQVAGQLESGALQSFLFDGQTAAMEDLLGHCEPELAGRVRKLVREQRIVLGPWYVMADQFLCAGEALLRNLEIGIADAEALGNCQRVGYLPDTFGHISQMPQILASFGIHSAVMWRGVDISASEFDWHAPDGTVVPSVFLTQGYYQHPFNVENWQAALDTYLGQIGPRSQGAPLLLTQGGDHLVSTSHLAERIAQYNAAQPQYLLKQDTLAGYVDAALAAHPDRIAVHGELRQNAQAFVLPDVLSTRRYLKRLNQEAEDRLLGVVEPLYAQLALPGAHPARYLEQCWRLLIQQQAHDSICGCSVDEVHTEMEGRYVLLSQKLDALTERAAAGAGMIALAAHAHSGNPFADDGSFTLFNPQPHPFSGWQKHTLFLAGDAAGALDLRGPEGAISHAILDVTPHSILRSPLDDFPDKLHGHLYRVAIRCELPGMGALACTAQPAAEGRAAEGLATSAASIEHAATELRFADGRLYWTDKRSGATTSDPLALLHELDAGDSYNYSPPPQQSTVLQDRFELLGVRSNGPVQEMTLAIRMTVPARLAEDRSGPSGQTENTGTLRLRLWEDSTAIECLLDWTNQACDQRTRLLLPVADTLAHTASDSAFSWEQRPVVLADYPAQPSRREMPVCVYPSYSAIAAGDLAFAHRAMQEYEVLQAGGRRWLGVTLVRSVGWLSRRDLVTRGVGAGPDLATPGAQCLGAERYEFSFSRVADAAESPQQVLAQALRLRRAPVLLRGHSQQWRQPFELGNPALQNAALRRMQVPASGDAELELRIWNPTGVPQELRTAGTAWRRVRADGTPAEGGNVVAPHAIATFRRPA